MKIRSSEQGPSGIEVTPLIDILFTLIIFFLATATFQEQERDEKVQLPKLSGASMSSSPQPLIINVTKDGKYKVGTDSMDLSRLKDTLRRARRENPERKVVIRGDAQALHGKSTAALAACSEAGFATASIAWDTTPNP